MITSTISRRPACTGVRPDGVETAEGGVAELASDRAAAAASAPAAAEPLACAAALRTATSFCCAPGPTVVRRVAQQPSSAPRRRQGQDPPARKKLRKALPQEQTMDELDALRQLPTTLAHEEKPDRSPCGSTGGPPPAPSPRRGFKIAVVSMMTVGRRRHGQRGRDLSDVERGPAP